MGGKLLASLYVSVLLLSNSCVTVKVPNTNACSVAGKTIAGAMCAQTLSNLTYDLDMDELIDMLEPQIERECIPVQSGINICSHDQTETDKRKKEKFPARSGSIITPSEDWNMMKTALEKACRDLGNRCTAEVKNFIRGISEINSKLLK